MAIINRTASSLTSPFDVQANVDGVVQVVSPTLPLSYNSSLQFQNEVEIRAQQIASEIIKAQARQSQIAASGRVFTRFDVSTDVIENQKTYLINEFKKKFL